MISSKHEYTVTCQYCDFILHTPNEEYAKQRDEEHKSISCPVIQSAKRVSRNQGEIETFLAGFTHALSQYAKKQTKT